MHDEEQSRTPEPRHRTRRVLAVRMLVAKTDWLDWSPHWVDGRVTWVCGKERFVPQPADLARAQRSLNRLRGYPISAELALGDARAFLTRRQNSLELAKRLSRIAEPNLPAVAAAARRDDPAAARRLAAVVPAEALCWTDLEPGAAQALSGAPSGESSLREMLRDGTLPPPARALAAMTLGALHARAPGPRQLDPGSVSVEEWLQQAYAWGLRQGVPATPGVAAALITQPDGPRLLRRWLQARGRELELAFPPELTRALLAAGAAPRRMVELAEALAEGAELLPRLRTRRHLLPEPERKDRREVAAVLAQQVETAVREYRSLLHQYVRDTGDPEVVRRLFRVTQDSLERGPMSPLLLEAFLIPLRFGTRLPASLQAAWLELLETEANYLWGGADPSDPPARTEEDRRINRERSRWDSRVKPLWSLLAATGDLALTREILAAGLTRTLRSARWKEPEAYRLALRLAREFGLRDEHTLVYRLGYLLEDAGSAAAAARALEPLLAAVRTAPEPIRPELLRELLDSLPYSRQGRRSGLAMLPALVPLLLKYPVPEGKPPVCLDAIDAVVVLHEKCPERLGEWMEPTVRLLVEWKRQAPEDERCGGLWTGVPLALTLSRGHLDAYLACLRTWVTHPNRDLPSTLDEGLKVVGRYPRLVEVLARVYPGQAHRCTALIGRIGLIARLDPEVFAPLEHLSQSAPEPGEPGWQEVLRDAPELGEQVSWCRGLLRLAGQGGAVPAGLLRIARLPDRLARELAYLESRTAAGETTRDRSARIENLRARIADAESLARSIREQLEEALERLAEESGLAAAERLADQTCRARLEQVAGPLPPDLILDEDWVNAALLSATIRQNRRLLRRLLRARALGDLTWREREPANVQFLAELRDRGLDPAVWLGGHPARLPCPGVAGGHLRLRLETDPLKVLQMGNYFNTCLSVDDCNAYSVVANAVDVNKRVIYAADEAGRVVGRQLIALNEAGQLVGYRVYSGAATPAANEAVRACFRRYAGRFAALCGLPLGNAGPVPRLVSHAWYDDFTVDWDPEPAVDFEDPGAADEV